MIGRPPVHAACVEVREAEQWRLWIRVMEWEDWPREERAEGWV